MFSVTSAHLRVLLYLLCLALSAPLLAQPSSGYTFAGVIALKDGTNYTYKLSFTDSAGSLKGTSVTDIGGASETYTAITGKVNKTGKEITFRETSIIKTKDTGQREGFCYIQAKLRLKGEKMLKGSFTGYMADGKTICGTGDVTLYSTAALLASLMKAGIAADSGKVRIVDSAKFKKAIGAPAAPAGIVQLSPDTTWMIKGNGKAATLEFWDDKYVDGDEITVLHNGKAILENYKLAADKKKVHIRLGSTADTVVVHAVNEGTEPPNTAMLRLVSGSQVHLINASTRLRIPVRIIIQP